MSAGWGITSPMALLGEWAGPAARGNLREVILLGFTVNLPFPEKTAIRTARDLGARVTVIGDAAQGLYDPVDVRLRTYITGWAACRSAFHPKLALLVGDHDIAAAIGSGNPTIAGWGHNDELWAVLRDGPYGSASGLRQLGSWLRDLPGVVAMPGYAADVLSAAAERLAAVPGDAGRAQVLHNLRHGLLGQLPRGPVRELRMSAPFVDEAGGALAEIIAAFDPGQVVIGLQEHLTSYDGDALLRAAGSRHTEVRLLPERFPRHGKLLEWDGPGGRYALTGSANLTASALIKATADGGNCELAVLAPAGDSLMPEGTVITREELRGRRTVTPSVPRPRLLLLGALLTRGGVLVTLARPCDTEVRIEASPDGSPGSWAALGTVAPGVSEQMFPVARLVGTVIRAVAVQPGHQRSESPPVFAVSLARCARRQPDDRRPRLRREYSEETIFTDEEMAHQFRADLLRLIEASAWPATRPQGGKEPGTQPAARAPAEDLWAAYLEECELGIGRALTAALFGQLAQMIPGISRGLGWGLGGDPPGGGGNGGDTAPRAPHVRPSERAVWARWAVRLAAAATANDAGQPRPPLAYRALATRLMVQLLAHGVWETGDESWREVLARLAASLLPLPGGDEPGRACQLAAALAAVCMGLLRSGAPVTGGSPQGALAARAWERLRPLVADADPDLVTDLLISPVHAHAVTLNLSELEDTIYLAMDDDPAALLTAELAGRGWHLARDGLMYQVTGTFTNPVNVAAQVATRLGPSLGTVLVHAQAGNRWAFIAWRRPDLLLASEPGHAWRLYRIDGAVTPEARFAGGEGIPAAGLAGRPVPFGKGLPPAALELLGAAGADPADVLTRLISTHSNVS
jgi:hypothetical protein